MAGAVMCGEFLQKVKSTYSNELVVFVNASRHVIKDTQPETTLLQFLRSNGLTGTKLGCGEGGCGACTVMVSHFDHYEKRIVHRAVNACLAPLCSVHGMAVTTVEGIGSTLKGLHPVQDRMAQSHGSQCGFCTPGIVMSMYTLLRNNPRPTTHAIEDALDGNLCRCTGYRPILDAFKSFAIDAEAVAAQSATGEPPFGPTHPMCDSLSSTNKHSTLPHIPDLIVQAPADDSKPHAAENGGPHSNGTKDTTIWGKLKALQNGNAPHTEATNGGVDEAVNGKLGEGERWAKTTAPATGSSGGQGDGMICPSTGKPCACNAKAGCGSGERLLKFEQYDPQAEPIFPPALIREAPKPLFLEGTDAMWFRPVELEHVLLIKQMYPTAKLVVGNTELGIETKFKYSQFPVLITTSHVRELNQVTETDTGIEVGSAVTLSRLLENVKKFIETRKEWETRGLSAIRAQLRWFASTQIRNVAAIGGNIVTASPISDLNPVLMAAGAVLTLASASGGQRTVPIGEFFQGYRKVDLRDDEVLLSVHIPWTRRNEYMEAYKQARRREDDIAIVNASYRVLLRLSPSNEWVVDECALCYGGMAPFSISAKKTEEALTGQPWNESTLEVVLKHLAQDMYLPPNAPGGMVEYRRSLSSSFFFKFYWHVVSSVAQLGDMDGAAAPVRVPQRLESAIAQYQRPVSKGLQHFQANSSSSDAQARAVGKPTRHLAGEHHVTGEAIYCDDMPNPPGGLYAALVLSSRPHARLNGMDASDALKAQGVVAFLSAKDVIGTNKIGAVVADEEVFATEEVVCAGQVLGLVVADTNEHAQAGARLVKVTYGEDLPAILTIEDAIAANSYHLPPRKLERGSVDAALAACEVVIEGEVSLGGQEHFYLETNATLAVPTEAHEMTLHCSTQNPTKTQYTVAKVLGIPYNRVVCKVKRMGGGFGGKETRNVFVSAAVAVAAQRLRRPVRIMLDRDADMCTTGQRHPFLGRYKVGLSKDGKVQAADVTLYNNAGCSLDLSLSVMERALFHSDNAYFIPHLRAVGYVCKTNLPSNTAFRGFGGPQGMFFVEAWMEHAASVLNIPSHTLRSLNLYRDGQLTHYGQKLTECRLSPMWRELMESSEYETRMRAVRDFNATNRYKKRGMSFLPTKFGMSFTFITMNQAGALVHVYTDGSVLVTHGGTEMGQGLHTKVAQIAADALSVPLSSVYINETSTDKVPNTSPTAASVGSDMNGMAVLEACREIKQRLAPVAASMPGATFQEVVLEAYHQRIDLSAKGFYRTPEIYFDWSTASGNPFYYFSYGVACSEVEVDCLTGDFTVLRTDILHDVGTSLNPAVDIGQIEGGFVQGMGLFTLEEMVWTKNGQLFTRGPSTYKIPSFNDIPIDMRVSLLKDAPNRRVVHSSKGVGEPPLFLGSTVYFAIRDAILSAREDAGFKGQFRLDSPATCERIRMACVDDITRTFAADEFRPWGSW